MLYCLGTSKVAKVLDVSERHVRRLMASGEIPARRVGPKLWRTTEAHLAAYLGQMGETPRLPIVAPAGLVIGIPRTDGTY